MPQADRRWLPIVSATLISHLISLSKGEGGGILGNIVVTATLDSGSGKLGRVAGVKDKLKAAIQDTHIPRINAFVVSDGQTDVLDEPGIKEHTRETESPRLLQSEDFADLVVQLAGLRHGRPGVNPYDYPRTLDTYRHEDFVGRQWLFERIARSLKEKDRGFIVLAAGPGFGKTAFVLEFIERYRDKGTDATALGAWHILRKTQATWVPVIAMVEQLEWRLRDRLGCPPDAIQADVRVDAGNAAAVLQEALREAAAKLGPEQRLLLVVDGIDEAFSANTPAGLEQHDLLHRIFPGPRDLPAGIFVLFASRPGAHLLGWLNDEADIIDVDRGDPSLQAANRADLSDYLKRELMAVANRGGHDEAQTHALAERMTEACEGGFYVAEWFARMANKKPEQFERWLGGEALPRGIDATLKEDWNHKADGLGKTERALLPVLACAIAIWHEAGTPVTRDVITDLFESARKSELSVGELDVSAITRPATEACLKKLRDWFDGGAEERPPVHTFRHSRIPELLLDEIVDARTRREVHRLLAWTSDRWPSLKRESRRAALANAPWHHALAEDLDSAMKLLADPCDPYLAAVYAELDTAVSLMARNYAAAIQLAATEEEDKRSTTKSTSREPPPLMHLRDIWRVLSQYGESLRLPECPLAPTLHNHLAAAWDPQSEAHRNLVQAAEDYSGEWLQRMNPEPPDRRLIAVLRPHLADVRCLAWSPDGKALASGSDDGSVRLWDGQTGVPLGAPLTGHTSDVTCVAWSPPAGSRLASGSVDKTLRLWDGQTGASVCEPLTGHAGIVRCLAWSPDGNRLVSASNEDVRLWDGQTGASVGEPLTGHGGIMLCLAWSRDGNVLAGGSVDGSVQLWDGQAGTPLGAPLTGHGI